MATTPQIDYDALAQQHGGTAAASTAAVDYDSLAAQHGGKAVQSGTQPTSPAPQPGFWERLRQHLGIPTSGAEVGSALKTQGLNLLVPGMGTAFETNKALVSNTADAAKEAYDAGKNVGEGQPVAPNAGKAAFAGTKAVLNSLPMVGPATQTAGEDIAAKNYKGAAGDLTAAIGQAVAPELAERAAGPIARGAKAAAPVARNTLGAVADSVGPLGLHIIGSISPRLANVLRVIKEVSNALPDGADESTHPATHAAAQEAMENALGPMPKGGEAQSIGPLPGPTVPAATSTITPATTQAMQAFRSGPNTIPLTRSGDIVINQALTALNKPTLLRIARARGINTTQEANLMASKAEASLVKKIGDSMTPDELDEARDVGLELSRNKPVQNPNISPEAAQEAWHYKVVKQFFPDVELPKAMEARAQKTIANRPDYSPVYQQAAKNGLGSAASDPEVQAYAAKLQGQDESLEAVLRDSINQIRAGKFSSATNGK